MSSIYYRPLAEREGLGLSSGTLVSNPAFSPDGTQVVYASQAEGWRTVAVTGGAAQPLTDNMGVPWGIAWARNGVFYFGGAALGERGVVRRVADGSMEVVTQVDQEIGEQSHLWPHLFDDDRALLFEARFANHEEIRILDLDRGSTHTIVDNGARPRFVEGATVDTNRNDGYVVFKRDGSLWAVALDVKKRQAQGPVKSVLAEGSLYGEQWDVSRTGDLLYAVPERGEASGQRLVWRSRDGAARELPFLPRDYAYPRISASGQIAVWSRELTQKDRAAWDLWLARSDGGYDTFVRESTIVPHLWTSGGQEIIWRTDLVDGVVLRSRVGTSSEPEVLLGQDPDNPAFLPQATDLSGRYVVGQTLVGPRRLTFDLWLMDLEESSFVPLLADPDDFELNPTLSPDGEWIAYQSDRDGFHEIYASSFPGLERSQTISSPNGGAQPLWSPEGDELFYLSHDGWLMAVPFERESETWGEPERLFDGIALPPRVATAGGRSSRNYDYDPRGDRFLMVVEDRPAGQVVARAGRSAQDVDLILVQNWRKELERLVAPRR